MPGVIDALFKAQNAGYLLIIITNQSGIARGFYTVQDFYDLSEWLIRKLKVYGVTINKIYYCPHQPNAEISRYRVKCDCRKPKLELYKQAVKEFDLDLSNCYAIGDKMRDCSICLSSPCRGFLIANNEKEIIIASVKSGKIRNVKYAVDLPNAIEKLC